MKITLSDREIREFIEEKKSVHLEFDEFFSRMKDKNGHKEFDYTIPREDGSSLYLKLRQNRKNRSIFLLF